MTFVMKRCRIAVGKQHLGFVEGVEMQLSDEGTAAKFSFGVDLQLDTHGERRVGLTRLSGVLKARGFKQQAFVHLGRVEMAVKKNNAQFVSTEETRGYQVSLESFVTQSNLAALERTRLGRDAELELELRAEFVWLNGEPSVSDPCDVALRGRVPQSDWIGYLSRVGLDHQICVEFGMVPSLDDPRWQSIGANLKKAQHHFQCGNWNGVALSVRDALNALDVGDAVKRANDFKPMERTIDQRWLVVQHGLLGLCHAGLHEEDVEGRALDRQDAEVCLAIALAIFSRLRPPSSAVPGAG